MKVRLASEALDEANDAAEWYEARRAELGHVFVAELARCLDLIVEHPQGFPRLAHTNPQLEIRRALLSRFPNAVVFVEVPDRIQVLAIAYTSRQPGYWLNRIEDT